MDNSLLAVRDINHKYIVVAKKQQEEAGAQGHKHLENNSEDA